MGAARWGFVRGGAVGLSVWAAGAWGQTEIARLTAADGEEGDSFGAPVCLSGGMLVVGARYDDNERGRDAGAAYVFEDVGGVWTQTAKLVASDGEEGDHFGCAVGLSGDVIAVGAYLDDDLGERAGSAYVFERVGGTWVQAAKILPADGAAYDGYGFSVAASGESVLVGSFNDDDMGNFSGSAYVFERVGGEWAEAAKLTASDGAPWDYFGYVVSLGGDVAVAGAYLDDDMGSSSGAAYVFERTGGAWTQVAKLTAPDGAAGDEFGRSVCVAEGAIVVGAPGDDGAYTTNSGSAYVFERVDGSWTLAAKLTASDARPQDMFGSAVSVSGDTLVVGAQGDDDGVPDSGSAYVFRRVGGEWFEGARMMASDYARSWRFGSAVWVEGRTALIGAPGADPGGAAYVFDLALCGVDFNADGLVDSRDVVAFLNAWVRGESGADFDGNGVVDSRDVVAFVGAWVAGC